MPQFPAPARRRRFAQRSMASAGRPGSPGIRPAIFAKLWSHGEYKNGSRTLAWTVRRANRLSFVGRSVDDRPVNEDVRELTDEEVTSSGE